MDDVLGVVWTCPALDKPENIGIGQFIQSGEPGLPVLLRFFGAHTYTCPSGQRCYPERGSNFCETGPCSEVGPRTVDENRSVPKPEHADSPGIPLVNIAGLHHGPRNGIDDFPNGVGPVDSGSSASRRKFLIRTGLWDRYFLILPPFAGRCHTFHA